MDLNVFSTRLEKFLRGEDTDKYWCDQLNQRIWYYYMKDREPDIFQKCYLLMELCNTGQFKTVLGKDLTADEVMKSCQYDYFYIKYEEILENEFYENFRSFINMVETDNVSM